VRYQIIQSRSPRQRDVPSASSRAVVEPALEHILGVLDGLAWVARIPLAMIAACDLFARSLDCSAGVGVQICGGDCYMT
jgi:hypothetical protein